MKFEFDKSDLEELKPVIEATVRMTIEVLRDETSQVESQTRMFSEEEAADLFGVEKHVLRDARNRNELDFYRIGKFVRYDLKQLEKWKEQNRNRAVGE